MTKQMKAAGLSAIAVAAALSSNAALGATAIGHVSVTILPAAAAVVETMPIELDATGRHLATRPGVVTLTGAPNEAVTISVSANDPVTGPDPGTSARPLHAQRGARADAEQRRQPYPGGRR